MGGIKVVNRTKQSIRVRIDCDRSIMINNTTVTLDVKPAGVGFGFSTSNNVEYDVFNIVDTATAFTTIHSNSCETFHLQKNKDNYAFLTVMLQNMDSSWFMMAENHPIRKKCFIIIDKRIFIRNIFSFTTNEYDAALGKVMVSNQSSKNIWVKIDSDNIDVKKITTRNSAEFNVHEISIKMTCTKEEEKKVYYRAKQGIGYTLIPQKVEKINNETTFHIKSSDEQYYLSIDYEDKNGNLKQHYCKHPAQLIKSKFKLLDLETQYSTPKIEIFDRNDEIEVKMKWDVFNFTLEKMCPKKLIQKAKKHAGSEWFEKFIKETYKDNPETSEQILKQYGIKSSESPTNPPIS